MQYIACFCLSVFFIWIGTKRYVYNEKRIKKGDVILIMVGLLIPSILAAFRDFSVGSDVNYYVVPFFNRAINSSSISSYIVSTGSNDIGYLLLNYVITRFTSDIKWLFFITELIIVTFIFCGTWKYRGDFSPVMSMLYFYLLFYNMTLSTVRQCIALSIVFFGLSTYISSQFSRKGLIIASLCILLAYTFHSTAIFAILLLMLSYLLSKKNVNSYLFALMAVFGSVIVRLFVYEFIALIGRLASLFSSKYANWEYTSASGGGASGYLTLICVGLFVLLISYKLSKKQDRKTSIVNKIFFNFNIIYFFMMLICSSITFVPRMMYYFQIFWCLPLSNVTLLFNNTKTNRRMGVSLTIIVIFVFWLYFYIISNVHGTYPYHVA